MEVQRETLERIKRASLRRQARRLRFELGALARRVAREAPFELRALHAALDALARLSTSDPSENSEPLVPRPEPRPEESSNPCPNRSFASRSVPSS